MFCRRFHVRGRLLLIASYSQVWPVSKLFVYLLYDLAPFRNSVGIGTGTLNCTVACLPASWPSGRLGPKSVSADSPEDAY